MKIIKPYSLGLFLVCYSVVVNAQFITTWKTDNPGTSGSDQITIPTLADTYAYDIYWEEVSDTTINGTEPTGQTGDYTITFPSPGIYRVKISGVFPRIQFSNAGDKNKILTIEQWGNIAWNTMNRSFFGCSNLQINALDAPDLSNVTDFFGMFMSASSVNADLSGWDLSNATTMRGMFLAANSFNGNIGSWDVSNVTDMAFMFSNASNFNQDISAWNVSSATDMRAMFNLSSFNQNISSWSVGNVTDMGFMFNEAGNFNQDLSGWDVSSVLDMQALFRLTPFNQDISAWNVSTVTNMADMFSDAPSFNQDLSGWDVSNVTLTTLMFSGATSFNADLSGWNVGLVTDMSFMFEDAPLFNANISAWNTTNVIDMEGMFLGASSFNQNLNGWDLGTVATTLLMFSDATSFNGNIGAWNTSNVLDMSEMFNNAIAFNQDLSSWDVGKVNNMDQMFSGATSFNQNIGTWNVASVTSMWFMFFDATFFNQNIGAWNMSNVTSTQSMFSGAISFNQDISTWDMGNNTEVQNMFQGATAFNQDISGWNMSSINDMTNMFLNATSFDQSLGSWDVSNVLFMFSMLNNSGLSVANYDATLVGWNSLPSLQSGVTLDAVELQYCAATVERNNIISSFGWIIIDAGINCSLPNPPHIYWTENIGDISGENEIHRTDLDGNNFGQYYTGVSDEISGIAMDTTNNRLYWTDAAQAQIIYGVIGPTGLSSGPTTVIDFPNSAANDLEDLALDLANAHIYFTHGNAETGFTNKIGRVGLDGLNFLELINLGPNEEPFGIDLDLKNSKIYYTTNTATTGNDARLYRADLNGANIELLYSLSTASPAQFIRDVKINPVNDTVYWSVGAVDVAPGTIYYNDLTEAAPFSAPIPFSSPGEPRGIDLDLVNNKIYWVCRGSNNGAAPPEIMRANLDGSTIEVVFTVTIFPSNYPFGPPGSAFIALDLRGATIPCTNPPTADAGLDMVVCESDIVSLNGIIGGVATSALWTTDGDGSFDDSTSLTANYSPGISDITNGTFTLTITTDSIAPCVAATDLIIIDIEYEYIVDAGMDQNICATDKVTLAGSTDDPSQAVFWSTSGDGTFDDNLSLSPIYTPGTTDLSAGNVSLTIESSAANACVPSFDETIITINKPITVIDQISNLNVAQTVVIDVTVGGTFNTGDVPTTTLLTQPAKGTAMVNTDGSIDFTATIGTVGTDSFDFEVCNQCGQCSSASVVITIDNEPPIIEIPPTTVMAGGIVIINVLDGITDNNGNVDLSSLIILVQPSSGADASLDANGILTVDYSGLNFAGTDEVTIEICDLDGLCAQQVITIEVQPLGVEVYNAVSPNGDGLHDFLEIANAEFFPANRVKIMNRRGDIVYQVQGYDNAGSSFTGVANNGGSGELPPGTYFYNIVLGDNSPEMNGFFSLRR
jgi:gliding motility-associated-like protein